MSRAATGRVYLQVGLRVGPSPPAASYRRPLRHPGSDGRKWIRSDPEAPVNSLLGNLTSGILGAVIGSLIAAVPAVWLANRTEISAVRLIAAELFENHMILNDLGRGSDTANVAFSRTYWDAHRLQVAARLGDRLEAVLYCYSDWDLTLKLFDGTEAVRSGIEAFETGGGSEGESYPHLLAEAEMLHQSWRSRDEAVARAIGILRGAELSVRLRPLILAFSAFATAATVLEYVNSMSAWWWPLTSQVVAVVLLIFAERWYESAIVKQVIQGSRPDPALGWWWPRLGRDLRQEVVGEEA